MRKNVERDCIFDGRREANKWQGSMLGDIYESKKIEKREEFPEIFYHGTSSSNLANILERGIVGGVNLTEKRKKDLETVFLTTNLDSALGYAGRSKKQTGGDERVILVINSKDVCPWKNVKNCSIYKAKEIFPENIKKVIFPDKSSEEEC